MSETTRAPRAHVCQRCYGPCRTHKGSMHGWTCEACLRDYLDSQTPTPDEGRISDVALVRRARRQNR